MLSTWVSKVKFSSIQTRSAVMDFEKSTSCPLMETLKSDTYLFLSTKSLEISVGSLALNFRKTIGQWLQPRPEASGLQHVTPRGLLIYGRTTPEQNSHHSNYNTKLTNSRYFHGNSYRIATAVAAILFLENQWALSPPLYLNRCNRTDCTKWGA